MLHGRCRKFSAVGLRRNSRIEKWALHITIRQIAMVQKQQPKCPWWLKNNAMKYYAAMQIHEITDSWNKDGNLLHVNLISQWAKDKYRASLTCGKQDKGTVSIRPWKTMVWSWLQNGWPWLKNW